MNGSMMKRITSAALALAATFSVCAKDNDFDGSKKLLCAPVQVMDCTDGAECQRGLPDEFGAPAILRVDVAGKRIIGPKGESEILQIDRA